MKHCWVVAYFLAMLVLAVAVFPYYAFRDSPGMDWDMRVHEVECLFQHRTDPFDVWSQKVPSGEYYPIYHESLRTAGRNKQIHAYTPWSYVYMWPFSMRLDHMVKWRLWCLFLAACFLFVVGWAFRYGYKVRLCREDGLFVSAAAMSTGICIGLSFGAGNYALVLSALLIVMIACLKRNLDVFAGICWALMMTKPQDVLLLAIPLIMAKRWKMIFTAILVCLTCAGISGLWCAKSPVELILEIRDLGRPFYIGSALVPSCLFGRIESMLSKDGIMLVNQLLGGVLCVCMCAMMKNAKRWEFRLLPAIVCASAWNYMLDTDRCFFFLPLAVFAVDCIKTYPQKGWRMPAAAIFCCFASGWRHLGTCTNLIPSLEARWGVSGIMWSVDTFVGPVTDLFSSLFVLITFAWCFRKRGNGYEDAVGCNTML